MAAFVGSCFSFDKIFNFLFNTNLNPKSLIWSWNYIIFHGNYMQLTQRWQRIGKRERAQKPFSFRFISCINFAINFSHGSHSTQYMFKTTQILFFHLHIRIRILHQNNLTCSKFVKWQPLILILHVKLWNKCMNKLWQ